MELMASSFAKPLAQGVLKFFGRTYSLTNSPMQVDPLTVVDIGELARAVTTHYANFSLAAANDHVVKLSVMTESYYWHYHPNSDETFIGVEGSLVIDLANETIELLPGQLVTIPKNVVHRTRPLGERSVNLTIELARIETVTVDR